MTNPQIWTLIGVFAAAMFGIVGIITTTFTRMLAAGFEGMSYRIETVEHRLGAEIRGVEQRLDTKIDLLASRLDARIDKVEVRIDYLARDVRRLVKHTFPDEPT